MSGKAVLSWSSGKDCAWSLHRLRRDGEIEVAALLTVMNEPRQRVAMHDVRHELVRAQADAAGLPLLSVELPSPCPPEVYAAKMAQAVERVKSLGAEFMAFGDLFLEEVRAYREEKLAGTGLKPIFPLWESDTAALSAEMVEAGLRALVTSVDPKQLDPAFCGRVYDQSFLHDLPASADPCGENGEFHSFCYAGPMFSSTIAVAPGEVTEREGYFYADATAA